MVRRQVGRGFRFDPRPSRDRRRDHWLRRSLSRSGPHTCRPMPKACAPESRARAAPDRRGSAGARASESTDGRGAARVIRTSSPAIDIACWDILGQAAELPVATLIGGRYGEDFVLYRAISQEAPAEMAKKVAEYSERGLPALPAQGRAAIPSVDIERIRAVARGARSRRRPRRRREHGMAAAPGGSGRARGARRGRLHRATLRHLRGVPVGAAPDGSAVRPGRE